VKATETLISSGGDKVELFVPGRICLFGEHSDWAGGYRRVNSDVGRGHAIIVGTNQGLRATADPHTSRFIMEVPWRTDGESSLDLPMDRETLLSHAQAGGFFSYACGVAYQILTHYNVGGLHIVNHTVDLPVKKGLSSSAATCVLVARAFNRLYDLKMTVRGEMEYAYQGEITTPSRCGRMDQGCAYGDRPVLMTFDGDRIDVTELKVGGDLNYVIVDLRAGKDTRAILAALNRCYPFPANKTQRSAHDYLGKENAAITSEARAAIEAGDVEVLGGLMNRAQEEFDRNLAPLCPHELEAPVLHSLLAWEPIQNLVVGGKGVGSGGDGTAQLLCRDAEARERVVELIEGQRGMSCLPLVVRSVPRARKAVIPAAGFGTRLFPASKAVKKELFPVVDGTGRAKPAILAIVEELIDSGIEQIAIVVQESDRPEFESLFESLPGIDNYRKLSSEDQAYCERLLEIGRHISYVVQESQEGFGHAVLCARDWVGGEPFLLALGDHVYRAKGTESCTRQLLDVHERYGASLVGVKEIDEDALGRFGCVGGRWIEDGVLEISQFVEKPTLEEARLRLRVDGLSRHQYLGLFGQYVLSPTVFDLLQDEVDNRRGVGELQLTPSLDRLRIQDGFFGLRVNGRSYDIGVPESYRDAVYHYGEAEE
jgi:UTP-glucose-1-phosphate uridylyltransferase/mevalonate kinase